MSEAKPWARRKNLGRGSILLFVLGFFAFEQDVQVKPREQRDTCPEYSYVHPVFRENGNQLIKEEIEFYTLLIFIEPDEETELLLVPESENNELVDLMPLADDVMTRTTEDPTTFTHCSEAAVSILSVWDFNVNLRAVMFTTDTDGLASGPSGIAEKDFSVFTSLLTAEYDD